MKTALKTEKNVNKKRLLVRAFIFVVYIALSYIMFITGRSHTLLIDNNGAEDGSVKAIKGMNISINGSEASEFLKGDREKFVVKGQSVKLYVKSFDGSIDKTFKIKVPIKEDAVLVSIPKLASGIEGAVEPFEL